MYVVGGIEQDDGEESETVDSVLKFDCRMQTWSEVVPMPEERDTAGACVLGSDIYVFGGRVENFFGGRVENGAPTSTTYRFNTETNAWATLAPMTEAKSQQSVFVLDGLIYVMGTSVHRFDPLANLWSAVAPMTVARTVLGSFVLDWSIYAVGGFDGETVLSSMDRYSVALDCWSEGLGSELGTARDSLGALVVRLEVDFFDSLIAKAEIEGL
jgi:N-acetylneuraminic acid mutarotase